MAAGARSPKPGPIVRAGKHHVEGPRAATHAMHASLVAAILVNPGLTAGPTKENRHGKAA